MMKRFLIGLLAFMGLVARADQTIYQPTIFSTGSSLTINSGVTATFASGSTVNFTGATITGFTPADAGAEPALGNPTANNYVLSSTTGGTRSWVAQTGGGGGAPTTSTYITETADATLTNSFALGSLATGLLKNTTTTGVPVIAVPKTDFWDTTVFASGVSHTAGLVPDPGASGSGLWLSATSGWSTLPAGLTNDGSGASPTLAQWKTASVLQGVTPTSPIVAAAGSLTLNVGVDHAFTAPQSVTVTDTATGAATTVLTLNHLSTGTPTNTFGTELDFKAEDNGNATGQVMSQIVASWTAVTDASRSAALDFFVVNGAAMGGAKMRLWPSGGVNVGSTGADPSSGYVNVVTGYKKGGTEFPIAVVGIPKRTATNTWSTAAAGTDYEAPLGNPAGNGYVLSSTTGGTRSWVAEPPLHLTASSTGTQSGFAADQYVSGSAITVGANNWVIGDVYHCNFDIAKTAAGTTPVSVSIRVGTNGTLVDSAMYTWSWTAQSAASDTGIVDVWLVVRGPLGASAASGIKGVMVHNTNNGLATGSAPIIVGTTGTGTFPTTSSTIIGVSFNGGASFSGTIYAVTAEYR